MIDVEQILKDNEDPKNREFNNRIVPNYNGRYGVKIPILRGIVKDLCKDDWRTFLDAEEPCPEFRMIKLMVIANAPMETSERLELTERFLPVIQNWSFCDTFCMDWKVKKKDRDIVWDYFKELIITEDEFKMRVSAVFMIAHFLDDEHIDDILTLLTEHYHPGYYYVMGCAWALSFCYIKFPEKTEPYLFDGSLDMIIRNKTLQKIYDSRRVTKEDKNRLKALKLSTSTR